MQLHLCVCVCVCARARMRHYMKVLLIPDTFQPSTWSPLWKNLYQVKELTRAKAANSL
jgi:hypothetical protein